MHECGHVLYQGSVYARPEHAQFTYEHFSDVNSYLHISLSNKKAYEAVLGNIQGVEAYLKHPKCRLMRQIKFDMNLIEVANGRCLDISKRTFIPIPLSKADIGVTSPRAFCDYDSMQMPNPKYFEESLRNSFGHDQHMYADVINKLYQCLVPQPHKLRKPCFIGGRDSGKSSWIIPFESVMPRHSIATITKEEAFATHMLHDGIQLVIVNEWTDRLLAADTLKWLLEGGLMFTAVKHKAARAFFNEFPFFFTANEEPTFGVEDVNVKRRLKIFRTKSLPSTDIEANRFLRKNPMDCIAWCALKITELRHLIEQEELFYEENYESENKKLNEREEAEATKMDNAFLLSQMSISSAGKFILILKLRLIKKR